MDDRAQKQPRKRKRASTESKPPVPSLPIDAPVRRRLPPLLRRAWYGLNQAFRRRIRHNRVTPDQFTVMRTLMEAEEGGLSQREIADRISSDANTIASLLDRMQRNGLIERAKDQQDRRARRIRLLPAGHRIYKTVRAAALELQTEILSSLPEAAREPFLEHLVIVADACQEAAERSPKARRNTRPPPQDSKET
jgi:DNA-binding MarR family transcriptional regulator